MAETFFDRISKNKTTHTPDVLSCLANLSNDEVFTPPEVVNKMLDMLPQELFTNPNTTFLDPACKTGVFLREIAKRLLVGLEDKIPDLQQRIDHIFHKQLYGIAITELTSLLSRRSVYCSKYPNGKYSVSQFADSDGNIRFKKIQHTWVGGKCKYCGASQSEYNRATELETHAYEFIHTDKLEKLFNMKFDVIIGNPPYQLSDGGGAGDSATPIYNKFIEQAKKLNPRYLTMIIPSRWMKGGKGLDKFRESMMADTSIRNLVDYEDSNSCFAGVQIDGGVCYFLIDNSYTGPCNSKYICSNGNTIESIRYLKQNGLDIIIRDNRQISIIEKVQNKTSKFMNDIVYARNPYGIFADLFNHPEKHPKAHLTDTHKEGYLKVYGVKGIKGGAKRINGYISKDYVSKNTKDIDKYKLFFPKAYGARSVTPSEIVYGGKGEVCTETFLQIGSFDSKKECDNLMSYTKTNFFMALLFFGRSGMNNTQKNFCFVPVVDFSKQWTDEELYSKYGFTQEEVAYIELLVNPMSGGNE